MNDKPCQETQQPSQENDITFQGWLDWKNWGPQGEPYQCRKDMIDGSNYYETSPHQIPRYTKSYDYTPFDYIESSSAVNQLTDSLDSDEMAPNRSREVYRSDTSQSEYQYSDLSSEAEQDPDYRPKEEAFEYEDASDDEDGHEEDIQDEDNSHGWPELFLEPWSTKRERAKSYRKLFVEAWVSSGLNMHMSAERLALGIAEIKIKYGHDRSLGTIAANIIRSYLSPSEFERYNGLSIRYSNRIFALKRVAESYPLCMTSQDKKRAILKKIRKYKVLVYEPTKQTHAAALVMNNQRDREAAEVWAALVSKFPPDLQRKAKLDAKSVSVKEIEEYSRDLSCEGMSYQGVDKSLKRYMTIELGREKNYLLKLSILRKKYTDDMAIRQRAERENQRRLEIGLPPIKKQQRRKIGVNYRIRDMESR